jgi:hypothetical protein
MTLAVILTTGQLVGVFGPTAQAQDVLRGAYVDSSLPVTEPTSALWERATPLDVALSGQAVVAPKRTSPFVPALRVRMLGNLTHAAFLIEWDDATKDNRTTRDVEFRDAVAILYGPGDATRFNCMGGPGKALQVNQWKADWQADLEEGFRDLQHAYPNFWVDVYPYAIGGPPYTLPEAFPANARAYLPGWHVGNPFSDPLKVTAVEDAIAEGFGTLATQSSQDAVGRGVHSGTGWSVVIARPLISDDPEDILLGTGTILAFAVWDGSSGDVGARKSVSGWIDLQVANPTAPPFVLIGIGLVIALVVATLGVSILRVRRRKASAEEPPAHEREPSTRREE